MRKYRNKYLKKMNKQYKKEKENQYFSQVVCRLEKR